MRLMRAFIPALLVLAMLAAPTPSPAAVSVGISVGIAPPALPIYEQPPIPGPGYFWTPGYWGWGPFGYYWIPGTWVLPPTIGFLWTPPWWGWSNGFYVFNAGYWGPHIGFYGGINYGFGYFGSGYDGGYWDHGQFFYNREVTNIRNVNITNVYSKTVTSGPAGASRVAFNGGNGGVTAQPTAQEQAALRERHIGPTALQTQHFNAARGNPDLRASTTNGQPKILATERAGRFTNTGAVTSGPGATGRNVQSNIRTTNTGPSGPKNFRATNTGPTGPTGVQGGSTGGPKHYRTTNVGPTGPTGPKGSGNVGPKTLQSTGGPGGHAPHAMTAPVHPAGGQPKGQPQGKDQKQHQPGG